VSLLLRACIFRPALLCLFIEVFLRWAIDLSGGLASLAAQANKLYLLINVAAAALDVRRSCSG